MISEHVCEYLTIFQVDPTSHSLRERLQNSLQCTCASLNCIEPRCLAHDHGKSIWCRLPKSAIGQSTYNGSPSASWIHRSLPNNLRHAANTPETPCGSDCYLNHTKANDTISEWSSEEKAELKTLVDLMPDTNPCTLSAFIRRGCSVVSSL